MNGSKRLTPIGTESFRDDVQQMRFEAIASAVGDEPVMELTYYPEAEKEAMLMKATQPQEAQLEAQQKEFEKRTIEEVRIRHHMTAEEEARRHDIIEAFEKELCVEAEKTKRIHSIENARMNALSSAYSRYGENANLQAIDAYYDGMKAMIDPQAIDVTDVVSVSIDNALHAGDSIKVVLMNGSIRVLPKIVASVMLQCVTDKANGVKSEQIPDEIRERALRLHFMMNENVRRQMHSFGVPPELQSKLSYQRCLSNNVTRYAASYNKRMAQKSYVDDPLESFEFMARGNFVL